MGSFPSSVNISFVLEKGFDQILYWQIEGLGGLTLYIMPVIAINSSLDLALLPQKIKTTGSSSHLKLDYLVRDLPTNHYGSWPTM